MSGGWKEQTGEISMDLQFDGGEVSKTPYFSIKERKQDKDKEDQNNNFNTI